MAISNYLSRVELYPLLVTPPSPPRDKIQCCVMCTEKSTEKPADMMRQIMDTKSKLIDSTDMQPNTPRYIEMIMRQMRNTACKKG